MPTVRCFGKGHFRRSGFNLLPAMQAVRWARVVVDASLHTGRMDTAQAERFLAERPAGEQLDGQHANTRCSGALCSICEPAAAGCECGARSAAKQG